MDIVDVDFRLVLKHPAVHVFGSVTDYAFHEYLEGIPDLFINLRFLFLGAGFLDVFLASPRQAAALA